MPRYGPLIMTATLGARMTATVMVCTLAAIATSSHPRTVSRACSQNHFGEAQTCGQEVARTDMSRLPSSDSRVPTWRSKEACNAGWWRKRVVSREVVDIVAVKLPGVDTYCLWRFTAYGLRKP